MSIHNSSNMNHPNIVYHNIHNFTSENSVHYADTSGVFSNNITRHHGLVLPAATIIEFILLASFQAKDMTENRHLMVNQNRSIIVRPPMPQQQPHP
ncbi:predicted protein [Arabidopsis lyrata subsp. lyrata]|uniref:Predicted protein n=1 Tax=Arabidopsis lyrata subsp. lyrata TaxID=81972 RepID=D7LNL3_ARALL|nr:predicted protein [Arabidopsis lyrata subsp. lyrata]